jgi:galactokinase
MGRCLSDTSRVARCAHLPRACCSILDPASIVHGRRNHLLHINTRTGGVEAMPCALAELPFRVLLVHSGVARNLVGTSGFNSRVDECRSAAAMLLAAGSNAPVVDESKTRLCEVPRDVFERHLDKLPMPHQVRLCAACCACAASVHTRARAETSTALQY